MAVKVRTKDLGKGSTKREFPEIPTITGKRDFLFYVSKYRVVGDASII